MRKNCGSHPKGERGGEESTRAYFMLRQKKKRNGGRNGKWGHHRLWNGLHAQCQLGGHLTRLFKKTLRKQSRGLLSEHV